MIQLTPMTETEFTTYLDVTLAEYAQDHVKAGNWSAEEALAQAEKQVQQMLPDGLATENQHFFIVKDDDTSTPVGILWFAIQNRGGRRRAFVLDIRIDEPFRRKGYGTATFKAMEDMVKEMGLDTIGLHVFGHNHPARAMYKKLGYVETDVMMAKTLAD
jgi:GNAT superfamily N-acetyltransferase